MGEDLLKKWAKVELERLDREEKREKIREELEAQEEAKAERYFNAPIMDIDGNLVGGKSISA